MRTMSGTSLSLFHACAHTIPKLLCRGRQTNDQSNVQQQQQQQQQQQHLHRQRWQERATCAVELSGQTALRVKILPAGQVAH
jgi:hypothetical protein